MKQAAQSGINQNEKTGRTKNPESFPSRRGKIKPGSRSAKVVNYAPRGGRPASLGMPKMALVRGMPVAMPNKAET